MSQALATEIQSVVDLAKANPRVEGTFRAMLILLENAPDSAVITGALGQIDANSIESAELREQAANLLHKADAPQLAALWQPASPEPEDSNVVALHGDASAAPRPPTGITFDDIGGLEDVKKQVRRKIINPFQDKKALFQRFKRKSGGGVLMYGPPGCGKTMLARALATECNAEFQEVRAAEVLDQYVGNAEKRISKIFETARSHRPVVLFFDEVEALAQRRQFESTTRVNTVVSALLTEMDGFDGDNEGILFLGATNVPWSLDAAFRRPGRFDRTIFVPPPDRVAREFILKTLLADRPADNGLNIGKIVEKTSGFSGADLSAVVETAVDFAIEDSDSVKEIAPLSNEHFAEAFREVRSSTGEWLTQARSFADYANENGLYDDLAAFLKKYAR